MIISSTPGNLHHLYEWNELCVLCLPNKHQIRSINRNKQKWIIKSEPLSHMR